VKKISAKEKAALFMQRHGSEDAKKNVLQILELIQTEDERNYWILVKSHLDFLIKESLVKKKIYYSS